MTQPATESPPLSVQQLRLLAALAKGGKTKMDLQDETGIDQGEQWRYLGIPWRGKSEPGTLLARGYIIAAKKANLQGQDTSATVYGMTDAGRKALAAAQ